MPDDFWLPVPGFEKLYKVSRFGGVVWSHRQHKPLKPWLAGSTTPHLQVGLVDPSGRKSRHYVHQLVASAFLGTRLPGQETRHKNGNELDNAAANLEYGTKGDNQRDSVRHGTHNNARKTACRNAHPLSSANTYTFPDGRRACRFCMQAARVRYLAKTAAPGV